MECNDILTSFFFRLAFLWGWSWKLLEFNRIGKVKKCQDQGNKDPPVHFSIEFQKFFFAVSAPSTLAFVWEFVEQVHSNSAQDSELAHVRFIRLVPVPLSKETEWTTWVVGQFSHSLFRLLGQSNFWSFFSLTSWHADASKVMKRWELRWIWVC